MANPAGSLKINTTNGWPADGWDDGTVSIQSSVSSASSSSTSAIKPANVPPQFVLKNRLDRRKAASIARRKKC